MLGMHGTAYANFSVSECDLLIAIGARFDDRVTGKLDEFASQAQIIHIDIDPAEIGKNCTPHLSIIGDVKEVLYLLLKEQLNFSYINKDQTKAWRDVFINGNRLILYWFHTITRHYHLSKLFNM